MVRNLARFGTSAFVPSCDSIEALAVNSHSKSEVLSLPVYVPGFVLSSSKIALLSPTFIWTNLRPISPSAVRLTVVPAKKLSPSFIVSFVNFGASVLYLIFTGVDDPALAPVGPRTSATMTLSPRVRFVRGVLKAPVASVWVDAACLPLRSTLTLLVGIDVPVTVTVFVETVSLLDGSVIVIDALTVSTGFLSTALILMVFITYFGGELRSMKSIS